MAKKGIGAATGYAPKAKTSVSVGSGKKKK